MSGTAPVVPTPGQRVELRIGTLRISGASRLEALRIADALPAALAAAIEAPGDTSRRLTPAERIAREVLRAVARRQEGAG